MQHAIARAGPAGPGVLSLSTRVSHTQCLEPIGHRMTSSHNIQAKWDHIAKGETHTGMQDRRWSDHASINYSDRVNVHTE
eukprot:6461338-Heterocapsa_arctica.AAC.1